MTKPDFKPMLDQSKVNELDLRKTLEAVTNGGFTPSLQLLQTYNQTVEMVLGLTFYLDDEEDDDDEEVESDLRMMLEGEHAEDVFQLTMNKSKKQEKKKKPLKSVIIPAHRWKDKI